MNQNPTARWSPMVSGPEDEFANFLDFGDLNFSAFDGSSQGDGGMQQDGSGPMDTSMEGAAGMMGLEQAHIQQMGPTTQIPHQHMNGFQEPFPDMNIQTDMFNQPQQQSLPYLQRHQYHPQNSVPPTPNSLEMHGRHPQYYQTPTDLQQQQMYEQYKRHQRDQVRASLPFVNLTWKLMRFIDELHPTGLSGGDSTRHPISISGLRCIDRRLQSVDIAGSPSAKSRRSTFGLRGDAKL